MSGSAESGAAAASEGVQVVRLDEADGARYELDEEALRRVLLRPGVQELPAVVVSVAGAYRGGKSFILDFFLRYLTAPLSSQLSGEWLGKEDEQLIGFHWRGGAERDTTGIHLWSEPIVTTLANGEKVAVLLMDTQGTFDSESTIAQNSTIFALSTLISSVQIYNLHANIKEDDLQNLQLFTEYGKLVCEAEGKAFQTLLFLVRDWMFHYEHAYGFVGGAELLSKRLESKPNQNAELREVREHINSSFEQIKCFLTPHPGLTVADKNFAGCIRDLTQDFRSALLQLVPALFDPDHLTPKLVNGERVRMQDLFDYFQQYIGIFNSDEVPEPVTIFRATANACLMAAARAARGVYAAHMGAATGGACSHTARALQAAHSGARAAAAHAYSQKRKLGSQEDADAKLEYLLEELDGGLSKYILENEAKVRETMSRAMKTYDAAVSSVCGSHERVCLTPHAMRELHAEARLAALALFDAARQGAEGEDDDDQDDQRAELEQSLEQKYEYLCSINDQNNRRAVQAARELYETRMKSGMDAAGLGSDKLEALNRQAFDDAQQLLRTQRNQSSDDDDDDDDPFMEQLRQELADCLEEFEKVNKSNKKMAKQAAENRYNNFVTSAWGPQMCCFHPKALVDLHNEALEVTLKDCTEDREEGEEDEEYKTEITEALEKRFLELVTINEYNNERAVEQAVWLYRSLEKPVLMWGFFSKAMNISQEHHDERKRDAVEVFKKRRRGAEYPDDQYYDSLIKTLDAIYNNL
ncbi:hypothetical protein PYW07_007452 [Mythimna separata]|uniref:GB1/RHD3-type G domain-containing protein n=1 Tax=Mythimna separata TaxID=271217 RepID=A0AAD7Z3W9_MYTSE|nr:hypothetical protein PYW07_007452 [Mythimna separata]